jgi:hypothetical protein
MAKDERGASGDGGRELREHPLIARLTASAPDAAARKAAGAAGAPSLPGVEVLSGYPARDPEPGFWRLYEGLDLRSYVRVAEADVVTIQTLATDEEPLRPSMVWVRRDAELQHTRVETRQLRAGFLQGSFVEGLGDVAAEVAPQVRAGRVAGPATARRDDICSVDLCRTRDFGACFTRPAACQSEIGRCGGGGGGTGPFCGTGAFVCGATVGCTFGRECGQF